MIIVAPARPAHMTDVNHQGGRLGSFMADPLGSAGPLSNPVPALENRRERLAAARDQAVGGGRA